MKYSKLLGMVIWMKGVISFMELDFDYCDPSANHDQYPLETREQPSPIVPGKWRSSLSGCFLTEIIVWIS